ncbi:spore gernimation protein GerK [Domibacillus aminovorans]|uniref:Spore gernimation protein GerK n=1 Tax=Domibacillus aminovorans TaxID=29332 RepID=A0A177KMK9_9BACI|nr:spore germination protein [Domibacillus aminovorans]OAH54640.1 spore gernimation protein GerK [Domibacillus aminovorans]
MAVWRSGEDSPFSLSAAENTKHQSSDGGPSSLSAAENTKHQSSDGGSFSLSAAENTKQLIDLIGKSGDLKERTFSFEKAEGRLLYFETIVDSGRIEESILRPLSETDMQNVEEALTVLEREEIADPDKAIAALMQGKVLLFLEGRSICIACGVETFFLRSIMEPANEKVIRGSHDGFVESLNTNIALIRERIKHPGLMIEYVQLGQKTNTRVAIIYEKEIANPVLVEELRRRVNSIDMDMMFDPGFLEDMVEDSTLSPFPQVLQTERPDRAIANVMDGRILLFGDGSPTCIIMPVTFFALYQSPDDYNARTIPGSFYRLLRFISFFIAILLPGLYIAIVGYHFEVLPPDLILNIKGGVQTIPFPPLIEVLSMELAIEIIREAGVRLPTPIGQTIGIVGGIIISDAVVSAGFASRTTVIVVAVTAISSFVAPSAEMSTATRLIRFPLMILASLFGFYGLMFGIVALAIHLCKLESLGRPYFAPMAPFRLKDLLRDTFIKQSAWKLNTRPLDSRPIKEDAEFRSREWEKK